MGREINFDSILALDKQIEEHERTLIQLKRTRNSLLNVSTLLPPEILGNIFRWNAIPDGEFVGLPKGSYNFLLVCHHWFEVASRTPELWGFWGDSVQDWAHRHVRCWSAPLDLVLAGDMGFGFDDRLRDAIQDRAARDAIRRVHLTTINESLLNSVISAMVVDGEETRLSSVESFVVQNNGGSAVDVSTFLSRYRFPKLRCLHLYGCRISSWDMLKSQTTALTTLNLAIFGPSHSFTLHITDSDGPSPRVPLHHLKELYLRSTFHCAFGLLNKFEIPDKMNILRLTLYESSPLDVSKTLGPFLGDHIQRRGRLPDGGLGLLAYPAPGCIDLSVGDVHKRSDPDEVVWFVEVAAVMGTQLGKDEASGLCFDLIAHIPRAQVLSLETELPILRSEELCAEMCDLTYLHLVDVDLSTWFIGPEISGPHTREGLLRGLDRIKITRPVLSGDLGVFTDFLSRRAAVGNQISSLLLSGHPHIDEDVVESIERVVGVFRHEYGDENPNNYAYHNM